MAQTLTNLLVHAIFSTKDRRPFLKPDIRPQLHSYMGGVVRNLGGKAIIINGTANHVHILLSMPPSKSVADMMRGIKANSSGWLHEEFQKQSTLAWQAGYGAFSVSHSNLQPVRDYIAKQEEHHKKLTFRDEFLSFLEKQGIEYDERYIWN